MTGDDPAAAAATVPPRWFIRTAWVVHRGLYRITRGRVGLSRPRPGKYGMLTLYTRGRRTGRRRTAILAYYEEGPNLIIMAMNGWGEAEPAWWLNLQTTPEADVELPDGHRRVRARQATGIERQRLWDGFRAYEDPKTDLDALAKLRHRPTAMIVLEPA